jgi:hypothetical protein
MIRIFPERSLVRSTIGQMCILCGGAFWRNQAAAKAPSVNSLGNCPFSSLVAIAYVPSIGTVPFVHGDRFHSINARPNDNWMQSFFAQLDDIANLQPIN